jgi:nicotinamide phosphoribosyltransferase
MEEYKMNPNLTQKSNLLLMTDGYKPSHASLYPAGTSYMQSYLEARVPESQEIVFYGLQGIILKYLTQRITMEDLNEARTFYSNYFGSDTVFPYYRWKSIIERYNGYLPITIYALPEGSVARGGQPLMVVESAYDSDAFFVANYMETLLSQVWYPTTVATYSREIKKIIYQKLLDTSDISPTVLKNEVLPWKLHDFGYRGVSSVETAGLGGSATMVNFNGTDTLEAILFANKFYNFDNQTIVAGSIPASEHSTMTSHGFGVEFEAKAMEQVLDTYPSGLVACVSDSFDIINACRNIWGDKLKEKVLSRDGTLVIRPDSGDPVVTTQKVFEELWNAFGGTVNSKGFRVLDSHVRMIQGDGVDINSISEILDNFERNNISAENITFGSGGALLQKHNRDTFKFAFKCNMIGDSEYKYHDVKKSPKEFTRDGKYVQSFKTSKSGNLISRKMNVVFQNGKVIESNLNSFNEIRSRAQI